MKMPVVLGTLETVLKIPEKELDELETRIYIDFARKLRILWNMTVAVIPVLIRVLGTVM